MWKRIGSIFLSVLFATTLFAPRAEARRFSVCGNRGQIISSNFFNNGLNDFNQNFIDPSLLGLGNFGGINQFGGIGNFGQFGDLSGLGGFNSGLGGFNSGLGGFNSGLGGFNSGLGGFNSGLGGFGNFGQFGSQFGQGFGQIALTSTNGIPLALNGFRDRFGLENFVDLSGRQFSVPRDTFGNPLDAFGNILRVAFDNFGAFLVGTDRNGNVVRDIRRNGQRIRVSVSQLAGGFNGQGLGGFNGGLGSADGNLLASGGAAGIPSGTGNITPTPSGSGTGGQVNSDAPVHASNQSVARGITSAADHGSGDPGVEAANGRPEL